MAEFKFKVEQINNGWLVEAQRLGDYASIYAESLDAAGEILKACVVLPFDTFLQRYTK